MVHTNEIFISRDVRFDEDADDIFIRNSINEKAQEISDMKNKEEEISQEITMDHQEDQDVMEEIEEETEK